MFQFYRSFTAISHSASHKKFRSGLQLAICERLSSTAPK